MTKSMKELLEKEGILKRNKNEKHPFFNCIKSRMFFVYNDISDIVAKMSDIEVIENRKHLNKLWKNFRRDVLKNYNVFGEYILHIFPKDLELSSPIKIRETFEKAFLEIYMLGNYFKRENDSLVFIDYITFYNDYDELECEYYYIDDICHRLNYGKKIPSFREWINSR